MGTTNLEREQNRKRQALKRQRDRVERIETQAKLMIRKWPLVWQREFLRIVRRRQAASARAYAEVEKTAARMPEGPARDAYLKANHRNTKVSLVRERDYLLKRKKKASVAEIAALTDAYEGYGPDRYDGRVDSIELIDWEDPQEVARVLGEDDGPALKDLVAIRQTSIFFGGRGVEDRKGFNAAVCLLRAMYGLPKANLPLPEDDNGIGGPELATPDYGY
jgi:hypothetical protein